MAKKEKNAAKCYMMCRFPNMKSNIETAGSWLNMLKNYFVLVIKYTLGCGAPSYIFHYNQKSIGWLWTIYEGAGLLNVYVRTITKHI